jgi:tRNA dimethylallyltransferase
MDIGTAKPFPHERRVPHHLIDIRDPGEQFNVGEFVRLADECCARIAGRFSLPVVSGGTGFYLKNFILGLSEAPPSDPEIRAALREELRHRGAAALVEELTLVDPVSAARIHPNDEYRLLRALEVFRLSGRPLSAYPVTQFAGQSHAAGQSRETDPSREADPSRETGQVRATGRGSGEVSAPSRGGRYRFLIVGLERDRRELYRRINERCAAMFRAGLPGEVRRLVEQGYGPGDPGMKAIGYREFFIQTPEDADSPRGFGLDADLARVEALVAQNSRRYAKRQITYFASIPRVRWIDPERAGEDPAEPIRRMMEAFLAGDGG